MQGERPRSGPDQIRLHAVPPPVEAEPQLVVAAEPVGVGIDHRLRPPRSEIEIGVVVHAVHVAVHVLVEPAAGREEEAPVVLRRLGADHQIAPGPGGRAGEQARAAAPLVPGGLVGPRRPGVAPQLDLRPVEVVEAEAQAVGDLPLHLQRPVGQGGAIRRVDERPQPDVGLPQRAPGPQPIPHERAADLEAVVGVLLHPIALPGLAADRVRQLLRQIAALQPFVGEVAAQAAVVLVGAALEHHVHGGARGLVPHVRPARVDAHLLELVEVPVGRRRERRHVGDHHAVERPGVLVVARTLGHVDGLLARFRPADVDAVDDDPGNRLQHHPRVARGRDLLQLLHRHVRVGALAARVDDRRRAGDHHRLFDAADLERRDQRGRRRGPHLHGRVHERAKALQRDAHHVGTHREPQQVRLALHVGEDVGSILRSGDGHGRPRQHRAGGVLDCDVDSSEVDLCRNGRRQQGEHEPRARIRKVDSPLHVAASITCAGAADDRRLGPGNAPRSHTRLWTW